MELSFCCCLLSFLHTGCKRCLCFSNADLDKLINISWMSINKIQTAHAVLQMLQSNIKPYYFLLPSLYEVKISFFILYMANSHPQNWKDKWDAPNIKYLMVSAFIVKEKSYQNQPPKHPEISRICYSPLDTVRCFRWEEGIEISNLFTQPCLYRQHFKKPNRSFW